MSRDASVDERCIAAGELKRGETFKDVVGKDEKVLNDKRISRSDIKKFLYTIRVLYDKTATSIEYDEELINPVYYAIISAVKEVGLKNNWVSHMITYVDCSVSETRCWSALGMEGVIIIRAFWGGVHECPICEPSRTASNYRDPDVFGASDWFFMKRNSTLKIADQQFHEIAEHGFFQSGTYRIEPTAFLAFFSPHRYSNVAFNFNGSMTKKYRVDMMNFVSLLSTETGRERFIPPAEGRTVITYASGPVVQLAITNLPTQERPEFPRTRARTLEFKIQYSADFKKALSESVIEDDGFSLESVVNLWLNTSPDADRFLAAVQLVNRPLDRFVIHGSVIEQTFNDFTCSRR